MNIKLFMLFELHILNILLSSYVLTCFEASFKMTLEFGEKKLNDDDVPYQEYKVKKIGVKGINTRLTPAELLLMLLNPMNREMNFRYLEDLLKKTID